MFVPTAVDEANAAKYYAGIVRKRRLVDANTLKLPMITHTRAITNDDLPGIYDASKLEQVVDVEWGGSCAPLDCFPFDINGDVCKPTSAHQTWMSVDGSRYSGCQPSCYNMFKYDTDDPKPSGFPLRSIVDANGKYSCVLRNVSKALWFGLPVMRADGTVDGLTNVPPMIVGDDESVKISKQYCDWFGLSWDGDASTCFRPWYQLVLEDYLIGKTLYRIGTVDRTSGSMPPQTYIQLIESDEYHRVYQHLASIWARHDPSFTPYKNTRYMFSRRPPTFKPITFSREAIIRKSLDENTDFDFEDVWESIGDNIVLGILRDVLLDVGTDKLLQLVKNFVQKLAKILETLVQSGVEQLFAIGGKTLLTSAIRSSVGGFLLRSVGSFAVRGIELLATTFATAVATFDVLQLTLGIGGLLLDLLDPLSLNSYLDDSTIDNVIDSFDNSYLDNFRTQQLTIKPEDLLSMADESTEEDIFLDSLRAMGEYYTQLEYNSIGQKLDWSTDSDPGTPHKQERTPKINEILYSTTLWDAETYNQRQRDFIDEYSDLPSRLVVGASILAVASAALIAASVKGSRSLFVIAVLLICVWLTYQLWVVARKTKLQTLMYRINIALAKRKE